MICPVCEDTDHRLYDRGSQSTLMYSAPYWENGVYHHHDANTRSSSYECSNGHLVHVSGRAGCPAGDVERTQSVRVSYKHDVCGSYSLPEPDAETCSWCEYKQRDADRKAADALFQEYKALPGWNRRRMTFQQWLDKRNSN